MSDNDNTINVNKDILSVRIPNSEDYDYVYNILRMIQASSFLKKEKCTIADALVKMAKYYEVNEIGGE